MPPKSVAGDERLAGNELLHKIWTLLQNIDPKDPIPRQVYKHVKKLSPLGAVCVVTGLGNANFGLQLAHMLARALPLDMVMLVEHYLGLKTGALYLHTPRNLCYMTKTMHAAHDNFAAFFCPSLEVLRIMLHAVTNHGLPLGQVEVPDGVETNEHGFVIYTHTLPDGLYEYRFTPVMGELKSDDTWSPTLFITRHAQDSDELFDHIYPFEGEDSLPTIQLPVHPYFMVMHAYRALRKPRAEVPRTPSHLQEEVELITAIGDVLDKEYTETYMPSAVPPSPQTFEVVEDNILSGTARTRSQLSRANTDNSSQVSLASGSGPSLHRNP
ncbi:uncharacterized protein SCHCODRAFT_01175362 [Schizophyllum commune H4-8]|nr:uncharacterized protein SCHCODRAFT_01175362 [Schizophyllum commune H4-8]KAI5886955.1 hypothetical protein SCHCODRAFT_01175362 [Schizophyllum commune H4-8]